MRFRRLWNRGKDDQGQSLLETAVAMPLLFAIAFNIINFAYFWYMVLTLTAAPRVGAEFSAQGGAATGTNSAPSTTAVSNIVFDNVTQSVHGATTSNVAVRVCARNSAKGVDSGTGVANCDPFGKSFTFGSVSADPEEPFFVLNRVDVEYTVTPIIPGSAFGLFLPDNLNFKRQVSMRSLY